MTRYLNLTKRLINPRHSESASGTIEKSFVELINVLRALRSKDGCAWDKQQTLESMKPFILEEAAEIAEAIERGNSGALKEELGDLFYNILHIAAIAEDQGNFTIKEMVDATKEKIVRRHPHVFGKPEEKTTEIGKIMQRWQEIKEEEKNQKVKMIHAATE